MKSADFAKKLDGVAIFLETAQATTSARALRALAGVFTTLPDKKVADVVKKIDAESFPSGSFLQTKVESVVALLGDLEKFVASVAPKGIVADFALVSELLHKHRSVPLEQFVSLATEALAREAASKTKARKVVAPVRADLVEAYNRKLEQALGDDDGFRMAFARLKEDPEMSAAEISALAKRFSLAAVKGREQALKKIFSRHQALMNSRAASRATAGRIAG